MSDTLESPEEPSEMLESEPIEQPEILESETIGKQEIFKPEPPEIAENYDLETVELPENFTTEYPQNVDKFGPDPMDMICPECGVTMTTRTSPETTKFGSLESTSCFYACLNFCFGGNQLISHQCPACDAIVGTYSYPEEQANNYRSGSPNDFNTNNGTDHVITEQDIGTRGEYETAENDDNDCLEVEDCDDDNDNLDGGDCDAGDGGGDCGGGSDD